MNKVATLSSRGGQLADVAKWTNHIDRHAWNFGRTIDRSTDLVPREALPAVIRQCEAALQPTTVKEAGGALALLIAPYPKRELHNSKLAMELMIRHVCKYPPAVIAEAIDEIHRTLKFFPTIAEIVAVLDRCMLRPKGQLAAARAMEQEHASREAARQDHERAEAAQRAQRERWDAERRKLAARYAEMLGDQAPTVEDLAVAEVFFCREAEVSTRARVWTAELRQGKRWAGLLCRQLAALRRSVGPDLYHQGRGACRLLNDAWPIWEWENRSDAECARDELATTGAAPEVIAMLIVAAWEQDPAALDRVSKLAAENRRRECPIAAPKVSAEEVAT